MALLGGGAADFVSSIPSGMSIGSDLELVASGNSSFLGFFMLRPCWKAAVVADMEPEMGSSVKAVGLG